MNNALPPDDDKNCEVSSPRKFANYKLNNSCKQLKTIFIDKSRYRYSPSRPIGNRLKSELASKRKTMNTEHAKSKN